MPSLSYNQSINRESQATIKDAKVSRMPAEYRRYANNYVPLISNYDEPYRNERKEKHQRKEEYQRREEPAKPEKSFINKIMDLVQSEEVLLVIIIFILMQEKSKDELLILVLGYLLFV